MVLKKWFIIIFAPPGNGKSLEQARLTYKLIREYYKIEKKYPGLPKRFCFTNQELGEHVFYRFLKNRPRDIFKRALEDGHLRYWRQPEEIRYCPIPNCWKGDKVHALHDCDLFCDEGANLFPATMRNAVDDMPGWAKTMLAQHRHRSIRLVLLTQDFMGINISARRNVWEAWAMEKKLGSRDPSPSLPPVKYVWGIYTRRKIDPDLARKEASDVRLLIKTETKKTSGQQKSEKIKLVGSPRIHWISRFKCSLFDTLQDVPDLIIKRELEHIEVPCSHADCGYIHKTHKLK